MVATALLLRVNRGLDLNSGSSTSAFHHFLKNRIPDWNHSIQKLKETIFTSPFVRASTLLFQTVLISAIFYTASALFLFRKPGYGAWILTVYFLHLLLMMFILGAGPFPLFPGTEYWENGMTELSRIIQLTRTGRFGEYALTAGQIWTLGVLQLFTGLIIIWLFRRKYF